MRGVKVICTICAVIAAAFPTWASYVGKGEVRGRVLESHRAGPYTAFRMEIESQQVTGPTLASPNSFLYRGTRMDEITTGSALHLWIDGGADLGCDPCGLFVKKVEFADGPVGIGSDAGSGNRQPIPDQESNRIGSWWAAFLPVVAALLFAAGLLSFRRRKMR